MTIQWQYNGSQWLEDSGRANSRNFVCCDVSFWPLCTFIFRFHPPDSASCVPPLSWNPGTSGPYRVNQFLRCPLGVHNHRPLSNFLLWRSFGNLNFSCVASALWLLKSTTRVFFISGMYCCFLYVLLFWVSILIWFSLLLLEYWAVFFGYAYPDWDVFVYVYFSLAVCVFWLMRICFLVLQLWTCAHVARQSMIRVFEGHNYWHI
jgi:hypothetical protein